MELSAVVPFGGGKAYYSVSPESTGVYQARLRNFEGNPVSPPPSEIILVRGVKQWSGSVDSVELLRELGNAIDTTARSGDFIFPDSEPGES